MPLWAIHHTSGYFTAEDKRALASRITDHYQQAGLPRFYVVVIFNEIRSEDFYVGGESTSVGLRIVIDHIARHAADKQSRNGIAHWINSILLPYVRDRDGLHWEFHVDETSEDLWMINGLIPPPMGSEAEQRWVRDNAVSPY